MRSTTFIPLVTSCAAAWARGYDVDLHEVMRRAGDEEADDAEAELDGTGGAEENG